MLGQESKDHIRRRLLTQLQATQARMRRAGIPVEEIPRPKPVPVEAKIGSATALTNIQSAQLDTFGNLEQSADKAAALSLKSELIQKEHAGLPQADTANVLDTSQQKHQQAAAEHQQATIGN